ncbi:MAG: cytochrome c oxidase assembly protein [Candidatus Dechloromonas phosphoritropha]|jgi:cytochrome c oxidase assembly protein subunit 11|nr:cytochrome c oxidase assembly protein [Candidatus Dechloromonas phosphoritropha]MBP8785971.1 cytochrome c oxidase assembly protein [Azonexus sp.]MBP9226904.1 cytochrome c oxidase assembly protein [Azonexus sp.]
MADETSPRLPNNGPLVRRLLLLVAGAFAFAFALVPLYNVLCAATGLNGKTAGPNPIRDGFGIGGFTAKTAPVASVDLTRKITVEFTGTVMPGLPWDMRPLTVDLDVHPGELQQVAYLVRNTSDHEITGQAVPSVTPGKAAQYFDKIECFCFSQQTLGPGESREMPLAFIIKSGVDRDITQITLSYAFFGIDGQRQTLTSNREAQ